MICTATVDKNVPLFLRGKARGWVTSEYGMLPRATQNRVLRDRNSGRSKEIQRMVGRCPRSITDMKELGERTIWIDCDVVQADGGTRIAAVIGGFVALVDCIYRLCQELVLTQMCITDFLGAVSAGICQGNRILDLAFKEDSAADVDMNIVMKGCGEFVEIQGAAERGSFSDEDLSTLIQLGKKGIEEIIDIERNLFKDILHL